MKFADQSALIKTITAVVTMVVRGSTHHGTVTKRAVNMFFPFFFLSGTIALVITL